jgi:UDP-glucose 4-epimerase
MTKKIAVLGAGFIGKNFIRDSIVLGNNIQVLDHKDCPKEFLGKVIWVKGDLNNNASVCDVLNGAEVVYHFISSTVPGDVVDEGVELNHNVVNTLNLLKLCVQKKVSRIIFISSASVYGNQTVMPISENFLTDPISSHGIHKLTIEKYLQLYKYQYGLDCKIMRLSNPYGHGQPIDGRQGFIAIVIGKLISGEPIKIRGDGSIVRDFIYIDDVVRVLHLLGTCQTSESIFNVGSGCGYTLNQVITIFSELLDRLIEVEYSESRFVDIPISILDVSKVNNILGVVSRVSLKDGLAETLRYHRIIVS